MTCNVSVIKYMSKSLVKNKRMSYWKLKKPLKVSSPYAAGSLDNSIEKSIDKLDRLGKELEHINSEWKTEQFSSCEPPRMRKKHLLDSNKKSDSLDCLVVNPKFQKDIRVSDSSQSAHGSTGNIENDLRIAKMAEDEYQSLLCELDFALSTEEKDMLSRANRLRRQSNRFSKMSLEALEKIRLSKCSSSPLPFRNKN